MKNIMLIPEQKTPHFYLPPHTITWGQDLTRLKKNFSSKDLEHFLELYTQAQKNPKKIRKEVEDFLENHPSHPEVLNLLTYIYLSLRKVRKGNQLIAENYEKNRDYLFARINYADLCLRKKRIEMIPKIFEKKWSLHELYPEKEIFHFSEFRGFMIIMGFYHLAIHEREKAECYHYLAFKVDPHHSSTILLGKKLYKKRFFLKK